MSHGDQKALDWLRVISDMLDSVRCSHALRNDSEGIRLVYEAEGKVHDLIRHRKQAH